MPYMYPTKIASKMIHKSFPSIPEPICQEIVMSYAHSVYADRSESITDLDILRVKWMVGVHVARSHDIAFESIGVVVQEMLVT